MAHVATRNASPFCAPKLHMALAIEARFDSAVVALVKVRSDKARREASTVGADDIQAGEIILNGVAGMVVLNLKDSS